ncbi:hypothetical protein KFK09_024405 [Dendrobium nobile]|uniref:DUF4283 domain-containing protein n=1 Tax=Dendrobium nobile TaxID=94219 RepID=A0A8T3ADY6_DENNO|nr:hypothetical protein KFK09_024405 [Dendrobium nobile]
MSSSTIPPMPSSLHASLASSGTPKDWKVLFASQPLVSNEFTNSISHFPTSNATAHFTSAQFTAGSAEWVLSLVGYSIGRRPYYEALLSTIKKFWSLKGSLSLLTLDDGFFLLKFNNREDYDMAWSGGPWFFFGKPFILQRWTPDFILVREEFPTIPLWIKIKNFPLSCWNPEGISKIASCVGIPLAVDALTAAKTRLTFARVCVQISSSSPLPDVIYYTVDDKVFPLTVLYDWKPFPCSFCKSIMHSPNSCPQNPNPQKAEIPTNRGRSTSRKPRNPPPRLNIPKPPPILTNNTVMTNPDPSFSSAPSTSAAPPSSTAFLPNLNSPSEDSHPSSPTPPSSTLPNLAALPFKASNIATTNKFDILNSHFEEPNPLLTLPENPMHQTLSENPHVPNVADGRNLFVSTHDIIEHDKRPPQNNQTQSKPSNSKNTRAKSAKKATTPSSKSQ